MTLRPLFPYVAALALASRPAFAGQDATEKSRDAARDLQKDKAQPHFEHAKALYAAGKYEECLAELETAHQIDPNARDLVFNLALVQEKLLEFDKALAHLHAYLEMLPTAEEARRAEAAIKRLEGAKQSIKKPQTPETKVVVVPRTVERGRVDGWTIGAASLGVIGLGVGIGFGIHALSDKPKNGSVTTDQAGSTYRDLADKAESAHKSAMIADIGFAAGIVGSVTATILFFAREKKPSAQAPKFGLSPIRGGFTFAAGASF